MVLWLLKPEMMAGDFFVVVFLCLVGWSALFWFGLVLFRAYCWFEKKTMKIHSISFYIYLEMLAL